MVFTAVQSWCTSKFTFAPPPNNNTISPSRICSIKDVNGSRRSIVLYLCPYLSPLHSTLRCCADIPSSTHGPSSQDSFDQYPTENGSIIIAKPLKQLPVSNPVYEDYLHVVVACLLALVLTVLLGLIIRHYGLTLPSLTRSQRSKRRHRSPAGDTESSLQSPNTRQSLTGLGFEELEKTGDAGLDDSEMPEKPQAAYLKSWR